MASAQRLEDVDVNVPNVARMYDYYLGGKDNYEADRAAADQVVAVVPELPLAAQWNRAFVGRAVRDLARAGIRQFLDIGAGLPTQGNVHEIAQAFAPDARVVYVDNDPLVIAHSDALLAGGDAVQAVAGDLRTPKDIVYDDRVRSLIDFSEPVAVLLAAVMHYVPDDADPPGVITALRNAMAPGSHLVLTHGCRDLRPDAVDTAQRIYAGSTAPLTLRSRVEIERLFEGFELLDPGLVCPPEWRPDSLVPDDAADRALMLCGVGVKP